MSTSTIIDGDVSWVLTSSALVMLMIPGLGYFYSGLARHKNALSLIFLSIMSLAVVSIQWFIWGFSLSFSESNNPFIGNLNYAFLLDLYNDQFDVYPAAPTIPAAAFVVFQGMFAAITPALALGSIAERARILPSVIFLFLWSTLVYDFIAYWTWCPTGWINKLGSYDFAGGTPVHIASGSAGLALALIAGKRHGYGEQSFKPHSLSSVYLGTALLWFGWFGFNGGSQLAADARAVVSMINTNLAACCGGIAWVLMDFRTKQKFSAFAFCSGAVAGLVAITPACGFVPPWSSLIIGAVGALTCNLFVSFKHLYGFDDALDVFGIHGVGGITGNLLTGIFASKAIGKLGGVDIDGGWLDGHFVQIGYQIAGSLAGLAWSFLVTFFLVSLMDMLPYLKLRVEKEEELLGVDKALMGEGAYDYIEMTAGIGQEKELRSGEKKVNQSEMELIK